MQAPNHLQQQHSPVPGHIRQQMSAGMAPPGMHAPSAMGPVPPGSAAQPNGSMHPPQRPLGSSQGHAMRQSRQPMPVQAPPHSAPHPSGSQQPPQQQPPHMAPPGPQQQQPVTHTQRLSAMTEEVWLQIGTLSEVMGEHDRALAAYDNALRHNPYSQTALTQIANIHRSREEFDKAVEYFQRIINIDGTNGEIWGAIGNCYLMLDDLPKAYQAYQHALNSLEEAKEPKLWYGIGIMYDRYCSYDHAEEAFVGVLNMDPNFDKANEIYFRLGIIHKCQGKYAQSLECFNRILNDPPKPLTEADIWFQIGNVHELNSEFGMAKDAYDRVLRENPQHSKVLQQLATLYFRPNTSLSNIDAAVQLLTNAIEVDKDKAEAQTWYLLGRCYMVQRQYNKAYEAYQQAVYRDGNNANYWCSIGVLYYQINQYRDALDAYSRAIRIDPYLGEVWFDLGALYEACNNQVNDAIDAYSRAAELDRSNPVIEQRLDLLRRIQSTGQPGLGSANPPPTPVDPATGAGPTGRLNARGGPAGEPPVPGGAPGNLGAPPITGPIAGAPHATENARHPSEAAGPTQQQALEARSRAPGTPGMVRPSHGALPPQQQQQMQQQMQQYGQQPPKGPQHAQPGPASGPRAGYSEDMAYGHYEAASRAEGASADAPVPHYAGSGHPMSGTPFPQTSGAQPPVSRPYSTGHPHVSAPYTPQPQSAGPVPHRAESGSLGSRHQSPAVPQQQAMAAAYPQSTPVVEPHPVAGTFQQGPMNGYQQYARQRSRSPAMAAKSPGFRRTQFVQQPVQSNDRRMEQPAGRRMEHLSESSHTLPAYGRQDSTLSAGAAIPNASRSDRDGDVDMEDIQPVGRKAYSLREEPTVAPAGSMSAPASDISMSSSTPALSGQTAAPIRLPPVQHGGMGGLMSPSSRTSPLATGAATASQALGDDSRKGSINGTVAQPSETVMSLASVISAAEEDKEGSAINSLMSLSSVATTLTSRPQASTPSTSSPQPSLPAIKSSGGSAATTGREPSLDAPAGREVVTNGVREMDLSSARDSGGDSEAASKSPGAGRPISEPKSDEDLRSRASSPLADGASETGSAVAAVPIKRSLATATADESAESSALDRAGSRSSSGSVLHAAVAGSDGSGADSNGIGPRKRGRQGSPSPVPGKRLQSDTQDEMEDGEEPEDGEVFEDDEEARNDGSKSHTSEDIVMESGKVKHE